MMRRLVSLIGFTFLIGICALAQRGRDFGCVKGVVIDARTKEPLAFARIVFADTTSTDTTITDFDGMYLIRTPKRRLSVRLEHQGYLTYNAQVNPRDSIVFLDIDLERDSRKP